jgi:hypothetical protein
MRVSREREARVALLAGPLDRGDEICVRIRADPECSAKRCDFACSRREAQSGSREDALMGRRIQWP